MAGAAAARELSAGAIGPDAAAGDGFGYRVAGDVDESSLRRLLRENAFDGDIRLSFECEPDALAAACIYGPVHETLVAHDRRTGRIVAMACRAERDVFVNGRAQRLGYLGQLRIDAAVRRRPRLLADGFDFCRALHRKGSVSAYLVSIVDDNRPALRLIAGARLPGFPVLAPVGSFATWAISTQQGPFSRHRRPEAGVDRGRAELAESIADCLQRYGTRHQLTPVWTAGDLLSGTHTPGLAIEDFLVTLDLGRVTACVACWDQRPFRQTVVRGYSPWLSRARPLINVTASLTGVPHLPAVGTALSFAFLSHFAVDGDDPERAVKLLEAALARARGDSLQYVVLGLATRHPLASVIARRYHHRRYLSQLYVAHWPDGDEFVRSLDGRMPHPEVAVL